MAVTGLNHVTITVRDVDRALAFYVGVLGCVPRARWVRGAYLEAGPLWLCLELDSGDAPDGRKLEIHVGDLATRLQACRENPYEGMMFFDA